MGLVLDFGVGLLPFYLTFFLSLKTKRADIDLDFTLSVLGSALAKFKQPVFIASVLHCSVGAVVLLIRVL